MGIVEEMQRANKEITARLKENFLYQLLASRAVGGMAIKILKEGAVRTGACHDTFDHSQAINELIREEKVMICFIGDDAHLWPERKK